MLYLCVIYAYNSTINTELNCIVMKTVNAKKALRFSYGLMASMGLYFAASALLPQTLAVAIIIVLLTGNFL